MPGEPNQGNSGSIPLHHSLGPFWCPTNHHPLSAAFKFRMQVPPLTGRETRQCLWSQSFLRYEWVFPASRVLQRIGPPFRVVYDRKGSLRLPFDVFLHKLYMLLAITYCFILKKYSIFVLFLNPPKQHCSSITNMFV